MYGIIVFFFLNFLILDHFVSTRPNSFPRMMLLLLLLLFPERKKNPTSFLVRRSPLSPRYYVHIYVCWCLRPECRYTCSRRTVIFFTFVFETKVTEKSHPRHSGRERSRSTGENEISLSSKAVTAFSLPLSRAHSP
jgi:hypothetical protein